MERVFPYQAPISTGAVPGKEKFMSFWRLYYHLVWATKDREPLIRVEMESRLYTYLVRKAAELDVFVYAVNGCPDHVHLIVAIPPKHAVANVVKGLKGASSHYLNQGAGLAYEFAWQRGYGPVLRRVATLQRQIVRAESEDTSRTANHQWLARA